MRGDVECGVFIEFPMARFQLVEAEETAVDFMDGSLGGQEQSGKETGTSGQAAGAEWSEK